MLVNILAFNNENLEEATATGTIATLNWDVDVIVKPFKSSNPKAPSHQIFGKSPRGHEIQCGAIWIKENKETGENYFTLSIPEKKFNANLGQAAGQDDTAIQAVIPW